VASVIARVLNCRRGIAQVHRDLVASCPRRARLAAAAWSSDPYIHAFSPPEDIALILSRSMDLRDYFERNTNFPEAYAVLGMEMRERRHIRRGFEGDTVRNDVVQTTVSFSIIRSEFCGRRNPIYGKRLCGDSSINWDSMDFQNRGRQVAPRSLEQERALLKTRLQLRRVRASACAPYLAATPRSNQGKSSVCSADRGKRAEPEESGIRRKHLTADSTICASACRSKSAYLHRKQTIPVRQNECRTARKQHAAQRRYHVSHCAHPDTAPQMRAFTLVRFSHGELLPAASLLAADDIFSNKSAIP